MTFRAGPAESASPEGSSEAPRTAAARPTWGPRCATIAAFLAFAVLEAATTRGLPAFSWMDPDQYYRAALEVLGKGIRALDFEVPTVWPLAPAAACAAFGASPGSAVLAQIPFALLLALAAHALAVRLAGRPWAGPLAAAVALFGPLALGLGRDLYIEFALAGVAAAAAAALVRSEGFRRPGASAGFAALFLAACLLKSTAWAFFAIPAALLAASHLQGRRYGALARCAAATVLPAALAFAAFWILAPRGRPYLGSAGNTTIPVMRLLGPPETASLEGIAYYPAAAGRFLLGAAALFLPAVAVAWRRLAEEPRRILLATALSPFLVLAFNPVKEPRHLFPAVGTIAALLAAGAARAAEGARLRRALAAALPAAVAAQAAWAIVPSLPGEVPYLPKGPRTSPELEDFLETRRPPGSIGAPGLVVDSGHPLVHLYKTSIALEGVPPNLALGIAWRLAPALVDFVPAEARTLADDLPSRAYSEPLYYALVNLTNRRCGYDRRYVWLPDGEFLAHADWRLAWTRRSPGADPGAVRARVERDRRWRFAAEIPSGPDASLLLFENQDPERIDPRFLATLRFFEAHETDEAAKADADAALLNLAVNRTLRNDTDGEREALRELQRRLSPRGLEAWPVLFYEGRMIALRRMADLPLRAVWDESP